MSVLHHKIREKKRQKQNRRPKRKCQILVWQIGSHAMHPERFSCLILTLTIFFTLVRVKILSTVEQTHI